MNGVLKFLRRTPQHIPLEEIRYYKLIRVAAGLGWLLHALMLLLFFAMGIKELFYIQFLSLSIFAFAFYLNERRKYFLSFGLGAFEVIAHQIICVAFIGTESGFQYYLLISGVKVRRLADGVDVDPGRLAQEVAYLAERSDITEELVRLRAHLDSMEELLGDSNAPRGKELDFLTQELHRETNTIHSKADDLAIGRAALAIKSEVEKIREQVQNVE